jgi:hypothetical protein
MGAIEASDPTDLRAVRTKKNHDLRADQAVGTLAHFHRAWVSRFGLDNPSVAPFLVPFAAFGIK